MEMLNCSGAERASREHQARLRFFRLDAWLKRQPLDGGFQSKLNSALGFERRLALWVDSTDMHEVAPTFHLDNNV